MEDFLNETSLSVPPFSKQQEFEASTPRREENTEPCKKFVLKPIVWTTQESENPSGKPSGTTTKKASKKPEERERLNRILHQKQMQLDQEETKSSKSRDKNRVFSKNQKEVCKRSRSPLLQNRYKPKKQKSQAHENVRRVVEVEFEEKIEEHLEVYEDVTNPMTKEDYYRWRKEYEGVSVPADFFDCPFTDQMSERELDQLAKGYREWMQGHNLIISREKNQLRYWSEFAQFEQPTNMPVISLEEAKAFIEPTGRYRTTNFSIRSNRVQVKYWGDKINAEHLNLIIQNAWKYRLLFVDTEEGLDITPPPLPQRFYSYKYRNEKPEPLCGTIHIPEPLPPQGEARLPRLTIIIADFEANVYIFRDFTQLPEEIRLLLDEFRITKVQSNIFKDVEELNKANIRVRGWADSQLIYRAFVNQEGSKCGTDCQALNLGFESYPFWDKKAKKWEEKGCHFDYPHLSIREILHATQDVRVPAACLLKAAILQAEATNMDKEDNVFPILMEAIDLVKSLNPQGRLENLNSFEFNWRLETRKCPEIVPHPRPSVLNKQMVVSRMKKSRADFIELAFEENKRPTNKS